LSIAVVHIFFVPFIFISPTLLKYRRNNEVCPNPQGHKVIFEKVKKELFGKGEK